MYVQVQLSDEINIIGLISDKHEIIKEDSMLINSNNNT